MSETHLLTPFDVEEQQLLAVSLMGRPAAPSKETRLHCLHL